MTDSERQVALKLFFELYDESSYDRAWISCPKERDDADSEVFNRYFDFLQAIYMLKSEYSYMDSTEVEEYVTRLTVLAKEFNYPLLQLEVFNDS